MKNPVAILLWIGCLAVISPRAQAPSAADNFAAGVRHVRAGDFFRAVLTLNEAIAQLTNQPGDPKMLARVHAFRAMAYAGLDQPERARAAVTLALEADPAIAVSAGEFNPAVVALFAAAKGPAVANPYRLADPDGYAASVARAAPTAPITAAPLERSIPKPLGPALIYIYWPEQQRGGGRQKVSCNGQQVAELQNNRFVVLRAATGTHDLAFRDKHVSAVVEAGREYHYRTSIEGHWRFAMGPEIKPMAADAAKDEMRQQGMTPNDAKRTRNTACVAPRG